jgi:CheY-like chemotaxis protein
MVRNPQLDVHGVRSGDPAGEGVALVVDDEPAVRDIAAQMLRGLGFTVLQAGNGKEALARLREAVGVRLVLLDLTMPQMGGVATLREIRKLDAELPVVLMSGWNERDQNGAAAKAGASGFLDKPFHRETLIQAVRAALKE